MERPSDYLDDGVGVVQLLCGLGDVFVVEPGVELRVDVDFRALVAPRERDHWYRLGIRLRDPPEGVLGARPVLTAEHPDVVAGGDSRDGIGHVRGRPLLPDDDGADTGLLGGAGVEQWVRREAK
mgnify:CR=1 FL=1